VTWTTITTGAEPELLFSLVYHDYKAFFVTSGGEVGYSSKYEFDPLTEFALPVQTTDVDNIGSKLFIKAE